MSTVVRIVSENTYIFQRIDECLDSDRYAGIDEDDDDECMESNFADLQKEEYKSLISGQKRERYFLKSIPSRYVLSCQIILFNVYRY